MKRALQEHHNDCGLACVRTLTGKSFEEVRAVLGTRSYTQTAGLRRALKHFGFETAPRMVRFPKMVRAEELRDAGLPGDAILKTRTRENGTWHWVVWDGKQKCVHDPRDPPYKRSVFSSYLPVRKVR